MKKLWVGVLVGLIVGLFVSTMANATSVTNIKTADTSLTIVFGAPAEFDAVLAANTEMSTKPAFASSKNSSDSAQPVNPGGTAAAVPEPSTLILLGLGVFGLVGLKRLKKS